MSTHLRKGHKTTEFAGLGAVAVLCLAIGIHSVPPQLLLTLILACFNAYIWARALFKFQRGIVESALVSHSTEFWGWVTGEALTVGFFLWLRLPALVAVTALAVNYVSYALARGVIKLAPPKKIQQQLLIR